MSVPERWQNQEEAFQFALQHTACMLDMDMGTGKTRVAIDVAFARNDCHQILIVCPKSVIPVWRENLKKFASTDSWDCWDGQKGSIKAKAEDLQTWLKAYTTVCKQFVVINYDIVWRKPMGDVILKLNPQMIILDESHRAKAAGSKVSKYLAMLGKQSKYRMCLSGTPMANNPLDVYGQYRFLDSTIFGTNYSKFLGEYAIVGGPERRFVVGYANQQRLKEKFNSIAYTCKMTDIVEQLKLPVILPPVEQMVKLPLKDYKIIKSLNRDFIADCESGTIIVNNILTKMLRLQQIAAGFCSSREMPLAFAEVQELNTAKADALQNILDNLAENSHVVVFCLFRHDLDVVHQVTNALHRQCFELSGRANQLRAWQNDGGVIAVQIQSGAEGVDMTMAHHAIYFTLPHSLALYNQSKARLYRPGQRQPVSFIHLIAEKTIDEAMYASLMKKEEIIDSIKNGTFDMGFIK